MSACYRNVTRSKNAIKKALITLLTEKKDYLSITVTDLVKEADVNRGTFYNHYSGINDVVNEIESDMMEKLSETLKDSKDDEEPLNSFTKDIAEYLKENDGLYRSLVKSVPQFIFDDLKTKFIQGIKTNIFPIKHIAVTEETEVALHMVANSLVGTYIDYLTGLLDAPLDDLIQFSSKLIKKELLG